MKREWTDLISFVLLIVACLLFGFVICLLAVVADRTGYLAHFYSF